MASVLYMETASLLRILKDKGELFDISQINENVLPRNMDVLSYLYFLKAE